VPGDEAKETLEKEEERWFSLSMQTNGQLPMKVIGRQKPAKADVLKIDGMQRLANTLRGNRPFIPKGVWRFKTFEEADAWNLQMMTRR
jgi:hypothetical protein